MHNHQVKNVDIQLLIVCHFPLVAAVKLLKERKKERRQFLLFSPLLTCMARKHHLLTLSVVNAHRCQCDAALYSFPEERWIPALDKQSKPSKSHTIVLYNLLPEAH